MLQLYSCLFIFKNTNLYKIIIRVKLYMGNYILVSGISNYMSCESTYESGESTYFRASRLIFLRANRLSSQEQNFVEHHVC